MPNTKVLLLDFRPDLGLGSEVFEILSSEKVINPQITGEIAAEYRSVALSPLSRCELPEISSDRTADILILVLSKSRLESARQLLHEIPGSEDARKVIVATEGSKPVEISAMLELGADDFITPPLRSYDVIPRLWRLIGREKQPRVSTSALKEKIGLQALIGESRAFRDAIDAIPRLARCNACVLIAGETGVGKEMCARAIHYLSPRAHFPFVPVNCGAIPGELIENELFGHERGAYTDAGKAQPGLIREAEGGSLLLDEFDNLLPMAQVKFLRFLQEKEYRPLGASKALKADVRIIAATNADLGKALKEGRLRQDLFYRLNVITLTLPPLRERPEDIPLLARHFLKKYAAEFDSPAADFSAGSLQRLASHQWPGNIRELENLVARAAAMTERKRIEPDDLGLPEQSSSSPGDSLREAKARFERGYVENLLLVHYGNITRAAETAHKDRRSFWELIRKHKIDASHFKPASGSRPAKS